MQGNKSSGAGVSHAQKIFNKDMETLRQEELKRRRLLRLEQVRQQSKDIANLVRQKVQGERDKQHGLVQERVNARTQQWQVRKLKELQGEYKSSLMNVGKGHVDASKLPDEEALRKIETEKILAAAQRRGQEALKRLKEEEAARRQADEERRLQLQNVKAVEEARSAAVVSLPHPESTVGIRNIPSKPNISEISPPTKLVSKPCGVKDKKNKMPEWPKRSWPQQTLPLGITSTECELEQGDSVRAQHKSLGEGDGSSSHQATVHMSFYGDISRVKKSTSAEKSSVELSSKSSKPAATRRPENASNSDVKLYDFTSCYQSQYDKVSGVVEKVQDAGQTNAKELADREISAEKIQSKSNSEALQREQQRGRAALQRVQVERDYKDLIGSLNRLARQKAALVSCTTETPSFNKQSKEDQLKLAFENFLQEADANMSDSLVDSKSDVTPDASLIVSRVEETPSSAPRLNLGTWQPQETTPFNIHKDISSSTDSIIVAPPLPAATSTISFRGENMDRNTALRSLVQRINQQRHSLLMSSQSSVNVQDQERDKELDVRQLEEKVKLQRDQLKIQRSEVKRLDASIVVPDCVDWPSDSAAEYASIDSTQTHESIVIESSPSDKSQDCPTSPSRLLHQRTSNWKVKKSIGKKSEGKGKSFSSSPTKDNVVYSMDVSLSSVVMDQTESSSSGSKSLSVHGVKVLVKVCGAEGDTVESRSSSYLSENGNGGRVTELPSGKDDVSCGSKTKPCANERHKKRSAKKKDKLSGKAKETDKISSDRTTKPLSNKSAKTSEKDRVSQQPQDIHAKTKSTKAEKSSRKSVERIDKRKPETVLNGEKKDDTVKQKEKASEDDKHDPPASTSTSYMSPPDRILSSLTEDIKTLISLAAQRGVEPQSKKQDEHSDIPEDLPLVGYINRLLAMSRESIDRLNVSCSEVSTPSSTIFRAPTSKVDQNVTEIGLAMSVQEETATMSGDGSQDQVDQPDHSFRSIGDEVPCANLSKVGTRQWQLPTVSNDHESLTDMTKQCHEKISALTKMIEEVRRQSAVNSSTSNNSDQSFLSHNQSRTPVPLDSTAYMSPPPQVLEWADFALPSLNSVEERDHRMSLDPYGTAVMQLLADVRSQMASQVTEPAELPTISVPATSPQENLERLRAHTEQSQSRSKPPVAFWRNIERCNVTSPTEPHELSTIPELGTTLPESVASQVTAPGSPIHTLSPASTPGTPPDVIAELLRRKLITSPFAWAKKKEKPIHSSDSSVSLKNSHDSDLISEKIGTGQSDISASKETNTISIQSLSSSSNGSKDWKTNILMSPVDMYSSADEVEGDFRRMGIGWVGAMLRKTKEVGALSSTSSSDASPIKIENPDFKIPSGASDEEPIVSSSLIAAMTRERSHSTPIKGPGDLTSSCESRLV